MLQRDSEILPQQWSQIFGNALHCIERESKEQHTNEDPHGYFHLKIHQNLTEILNFIPQ